MGFSKVASPKKKPWAVRLGKGVFIDVIIHQTETQQKAEEWMQRYKNIHQRDPVLKTLGVMIINLLEKVKKD